VRVSLSREDFPRSVSKSWQKLLKDEKFVDCTLVCENSKQVKVHKVILSSSSKFFCDILTENPHPHPLIYLKGVNQDKLLKIIEFIYTGKTLIREQEVHDFVGLGKDLQVEGLIDEHFQSRAAMRSRRSSSVPKPENEAGREKPDHGVLNIPDEDNNSVDDEDTQKIDDETADAPDLGVEEVAKKRKGRGKGKGKVTVGERSSPRKKRNLGNFVDDEDALKIDDDETTDVPDLGVEEVSKKPKGRGKGKGKMTMGKRSSPRKKRNSGNFVNFVDDEDAHKIDDDEMADVPDLGVEEVSKKPKGRGKGKGKMTVGKRSSPRKKRNVGKCPMCDQEFDMLLLEFHAYNCQG